MIRIVIRRMMIIKVKNCDDQVIITVVEIITVWFSSSWSQTWWYMSHHLKIMVTIIFIIININNCHKSSSSYWVSIAIWNSSRANRPHPHSLHLFVGMHPYCLALSSSSNVIIRIHKYSYAFITFIRGNASLLLSIVIIIKCNHMYSCIHYNCSSAYSLIAWHSHCQFQPYSRSSYA